MVLNTNSDIFKSEEKPLAVLVSVRCDDDDEAECDASLDELERLLETAGGELYATVVQSRQSPDPRTCVGSGKLSEIAEVCKNGSVKLVVFDTELTPAQIKNLEDGIEEDVTVIDRPMLILDIFALHAVTGEGKLQVELAQLKYSAPRLIGKGKQLSRLGGGIGTRGPGESKLETDRRHLKRRTEALEEQCRLLEKNRSVKRASRDRSGMFRIAIAGYTNAGKSTLLNYLTGAGILSEDKLFATLDPTTRKFGLPDGTNVLLTDTVGFIRNLPTQLIKAFKSTLDEVVFCDAVLVVADASDPECEKQTAVTRGLINELGASDKPLIFAFNKCDRLTDGFTVPAEAGTENAVCISAVTGEGISKLIDMISKTVNGGKTTEVFEFPSHCGSALNYLYKNASVLSCEYIEDTVKVIATLDVKTKGTVLKLIQNSKN